jgi:hypothetical protein
VRASAVIALIDQVAFKIFFRQLFCKGFPVIPHPQKTVQDQNGFSTANYIAV